MIVAVNWLITYWSRVGMTARRALERTWQHSGISFSVLVSWVSEPLRPRIIDLYHSAPASWMYLIMLTNMWQTADEKTIGSSLPLNKTTTSMLPTQDSGHHGAQEHVQYIGPTAARIVTVHSTTNTLAGSVQVRTSNTTRRLTRLQLTKCKVIRLNALATYFSVIVLTWH